MSAVARSESCSPPGAAGVKFDPAPLPRREGQQRQPRERSELEHRDQVHEAGGALHPDIVQEPHHHDCRGGDVAHLGRREGKEIAEVFGEDGGDGAERGGADDRQLGPPEEKGRERAEPLEQVGEHPARPGQRRGQLGQGQGAEQGDDAAHHPGDHDGTGFLQASRDTGGHPEDAATDGGADQNRDGAPQAQVAGKPLTPGIGRL